jgi:hypothetical protein
LHDNSVHPEPLQAARARKERARQDRLAAEEAEREEVRSLQQHVMPSCRTVIYLIQQLFAGNLNAERQVPTQTGAGTAAAALACYPQPCQDAKHGTCILLLHC